MGVLKELTNSQLKKFSRRFKVGHVDQATQLFKAFEPAELFFVLVEGQVNILLDSKKGSQVWDRTLEKKGDFFGRTALYSSK